MILQNLRPIHLASLVAITLVISSCAGNQASNPNGQAGGGSNGNASSLSGNVTIDGSSTVFPISEVMAEEFRKTNSGVDVAVGESGTGGGFKKFCAGEISLTGASRPIKPEEVEACKKGNVEYIEIPIAYDALTVVASPQNEPAKCMKVADLKKVWEPAAQGKITNWKQINPSFPDLKLNLYGAGTDSGTFDYFTKEIVGKEKDSRSDYTASEDDNTLVQGVAGDKGGLGYFGYAYYEANKTQLKALEIDDGKGCVAPSAETVLNGTYTPLSRPIFVYASKKDLERPEVKAFADFMIASNNKKLIAETGYVPLPDELRAVVQKRYESGQVGSLYQGAPKGSTLKDLLAKSK
jgi:phosphate transport system substrate-binding protein